LVADVARPEARSARLPVEPWPHRALLLVIALTALGAGGLVVVWWKVHREAVFADQWPWVGMGVLCLALPACAGAVWLTLGMRNVRALKQVMSHRCRGALLDAERARTDLAGRNVGSLVCVPRGLKYHRSDCYLVTGKDLAPYAHPRSLTQELSPCQVCRP
jgi:hypothetical protein